MFCCFCNHNFLNLSPAGAALHLTFGAAYGDVVSGFGEHDAVVIAPCDEVLDNGGHLSGIEVGGGAEISNFLTPNLLLNLESERASVFFKKDLLGLVCRATVLMGEISTEEMQKAVLLVTAFGVVLLKLYVELLFLRTVEKVVGGKQVAWI